MYDRVNLSAPDDLGVEPGRRSPQGAYFVRVTGFSPEIRRMIWAVHEAARRNNAIIEGQIPNPDASQHEYFNNILGTAFEEQEDFILAALDKWVPRMNRRAKAEFAGAMTALYAELRRQGKSESMLKNLYVKFMCWLYYRFERTVSAIGSGDAMPKVLYQTDGITQHELLFLEMLNRMGVDILLIEPRGDDAYLKLDPTSASSQLYAPQGTTEFPSGFSLRALRDEMARQSAPAPVRDASRQNPTAPVQPRPAPFRASDPPGRVGAQPHPQQSAVPRRQPAPAPRPAAGEELFRQIERLFPKARRERCTNAWMQNARYDSILTPAIIRGEDPALFYNAFVRVDGAEDKLTYANELYQFYLNLRNTGRQIMIIDGGIPQPENDEIARVRRRPYRDAADMIVDVATNLPSNADVEIQRALARAFAHMMCLAAADEENLNKLTVTAVTLVCWINRYQRELFGGLKRDEVPCLIKMGGCRNAHEALYMRLMAELPVDVLILAPNLDNPCMIRDEALLDLKYQNTLPDIRFPRDSGDLQLSTVASHAERELDSMLYADSGLYRNRQFQTATAITLDCTVDEVFQLWDQELKYRPNFSTAGGVVNMPVIYAKLSGVENGREQYYWQRVKQLTDGGAYVITGFPFIRPGSANAYQSLASQSLRRGRLLRKELKSDHRYPYGMLRDEVQEHMLDKLQLMLDRKIIRGTFENGSEYMIISVVLSLSRDIVRMIQSFDFTRKNPKVVCVNVKEQSPSIEDAVMLTFLNLIGFDIAMFIPTGYQMIERYLNEDLPREFQMGEYRYDMSIPDFNSLPVDRLHNWLGNILKRGI